MPDEHAEPLPEKASEEEGAAREVSRRNIGVVLTALVTAVVLATAFVLWSYGTLWPFGNLTPKATAEQVGPTENAFQTGVIASDGVVKRAIINEWRSVRSNHKAIAYTIS